MTGKTEYPKNKIAKVTLFSGEIKTLAVEWVWYWNGKPERVYGKDINGRNYYKHKQDEEPFEILDAPVEDWDCGCYEGAEDVCVSVTCPRK